MRKCIVIIELPLCRCENGLDGGYFIFENVIIFMADFKSKLFLLKRTTLNKKEHGIKVIFAMMDIRST